MQAMASREFLRLPNFRHSNEVKVKSNLFGRAQYLFVSNSKTNHRTFKKQLPTDTIKVAIRGTDTYYLFIGRLAK
jgi:hypothetical protein